MANHRKFAGQLALIKPRHGKKDCVRLGVDIEEGIKDRILAVAKQDGTTQSDVVRDALDFYLDAVGQR